MLTLYRAGMHLREGTRFSCKEVLLLFVVTAGITLSNGIVVLLAAMSVNGRAAFRPRFFFTTLVLPGVLMLALGVGLAEHAKNEAATKPKAQSVEMSTSAVGQQFKWTRDDLSRTAVVVENLFGESIQLHRKHVLGDVLSGRPVIVEYSWKIQYAVEAAIIIMFIVGTFVGRKQRFEQLLLAVFMFNMLLHVGLGFALDEIHIMTAHWAFVVPLSIAWLFCYFKRRQTAAFTYLLVFTLIAVITVYMFAYHGYLLHRYLTWPLCK